MHYRKFFADIGGGAIKRTSAPDTPDIDISDLITTHVCNIFDKDTMVYTGKVVTGDQLVTTPNYNYALVPVKPNSQYALQKDVVWNDGDYRVSTRGQLGYLSDEDTLISAVDMLTLDKTTDGFGVTFTTPNNCNYIMLGMAKTDTGEKIQIDEGDTIHNYYRAYNEQYSFIYTLTPDEALVYPYSTTPVCAITGEGELMKLCNIESLDDSVVIVDDMLTTTTTMDKDIRIKITNEKESETISYRVKTTFDVPFDETIGNVRTDYTRVAIEHPPESIQVGEEYVLHALLEPYEGKNCNLVKYASSNPDVCTVMYGVLTGISTGKATITVSDVEETVSNSFDITVVEKPIEQTILPNEIYYVDNSLYGIDPNKSNMDATTQGIRNALNYASTNGFKKIVFNKGDYLVNPILEGESYSSGLIKIPSNMIVDFSGATVYTNPVSDDTDIKYAIFMLNDIENTKITNLIMRGDRYTANYSNLNAVSEHRLNIKIGKCVNCGLENCTIGDSIGFNIETIKSKKGNAYIHVDLKPEDVEVGAYDEFGNKDDLNVENRYRTKTLKDLSVLEGHFEMGHAIGYSGYIAGFRVYDIHFYNANKEFISTYKDCMQFFRYDLPEHARYAHITFHSKADLTTSNVYADTGYFASLYTLNEAYKCYIRNCIIENNYNAGIAMCGGKRWLIENNTFINNGGSDPDCAVDYEDGWESAGCDIWRYNHFTSYGRIIAVSGQSIAWHNNVFECTIGTMVRTQNYRFYHNKFYSSSSFASQTDMVIAQNILYHSEPRLTGENYHGDVSEYKPIYIGNIKAFK